jgi:hypothetical protein
MLEEWCVSAFGNEVVRIAVGGETLMAALFVVFQAIDGNGYAVVQLAILWAVMVAVSVLAFRAGRTTGILEATGYEVGDQ